MPLRRIRPSADYSDIKKVKFLKRLSTLGLTGLFVGLVGLIILIIFFFTQVPSPEDLQNRSVAQSTKIYDRNGELLYDIFQNQNRTPVKLSDVPEVVKKVPHSCHRFWWIGQ